MPWRTLRVSSPAMTMAAMANLPRSAGEQVAQIAWFREVEHCRDHDRGERRMRHSPEQRRQQNQRQKAKNRCNEVGELGARAGSHRDGGLRQAADDEKPPEKTVE